MLASLLFPLVLGQAADLKPFRSPEHGIELSIPSNWKVTRDRIRQTITFNQTRIEVFSTNYQRPQADWQKIQKDINEQMGRTVERQWDEVFLGVPLLMTRVKWSDARTGPRGLLVGLLYAETPSKFHFRLESPAAEFAASEEAWRAALQTLRTSNSRLPEPEDGQSTVATAPEPPAVAPPRVISLSETGRQVRPLASSRIAFEVRGARGVFRFPKDVRLSGGGPWQVTAPGFPSGLALEIFLNDQSRPSGQKVLTQMAERLSDFQSVALRESDGPRQSPVGQDIFWTARVGRDATGDRMDLIATVDSGQFHAILQFTGREVRQFGAQRRAMRALVDRLGFERP